MLTASFLRWIAGIAFESYVVVLVSFSINDILHLAASDVVLVGPPTENGMVTNCLFGLCFC
jgi:hypothetical protein